MSVINRSKNAFTIILILVTVISFSFSSGTIKEAELNSFERLSGEKSLLKEDLFEYGYSRYKELESKKMTNSNKKILTLIDFGLSSNKKRLWVIDLRNNKILYNTFVAHGKNSGNEYATKFSNEPGSYKSSLGFYITGETYFGKHGLSLYLDGIDKGSNDNARSRAIVMHGADYAENSFIGKYGRLGRSFGCPAIPTSISKELIETLKGKTGILIYHSQNKP